MFKNADHWAPPQKIPGCDPGIFIKETPPPRHLTHMPTIDTAAAGPLPTRGQVPMVPHISFKSPTSASHRPTPLPHGPPEALPSSGLSPLPRSTSESSLHCSPLSLAETTGVHSPPWEQGPPGRQDPALEVDHQLLREHRVQGAGYSC